MPRWFSRLHKNKQVAPSRTVAVTPAQDPAINETIEAGLFPVRVASRNGAKLFRFGLKVALVTLIAIVAFSYFGLVEPIRQFFQPMQAGTGTLIVSSDYTRTQVLLDGKVVGQTPFTGENIDAGRHTLTFQAADNASGFFTEEGIDIVVNPGNTTIVKANLAPDSSMFSYTIITSAIRQSGDGLLVVKALQHEVQVRVDGNVVGKAPFISDSLGVGSHQILIEREGYKPVLVDITVATDRVVTVESKLYQYQINLER
jgi:hypothetical protein